MNSGIIIIGSSIVVISIMIYIIKNFDNILECYNKNKEKKIVKILLIIITILIILVFSKIIVENFNSTINGIKKYFYSIENDKKYQEYDNQIIKEYEIYENAISKKYENQKYKIPYIPEDFAYVEGEWNTGFVIQDEKGNQYVWVPCTNKENLEVPKLQRKNFSENSFISKDMCCNYEYEKFITSSLENGGFYISRFEIGNENGNPVSKKGAEVWTGVTKTEAQNIVKNMENNVNCQLMNGYAYDTTYLWLLKNNSIETISLDVKEKVISGTKSCNNIYDFADNIMEITTEENYGTVIIRGAFLKDQKREKNNFDRVSISESESYFSDGTKLGFRTIIYK